MDNKLIEQYKDDFLCPDSREDLHYVTKSGDTAEFVNKFETKFTVMKGFVDFTGGKGAPKVVDTNKSKKVVEPSPADIYENYLESKDWKAKLFSSMTWGEKLTAPAFTKAMKVFLTEHQTGTFLDLPVATGLVSVNAFAEFKDMRFYAVDRSTEALNRAYFKLWGRNITNTILVQADYNKLPFKAEYFDGVTAFAGVNFIKNIKEAFREIFRVLKKGRRFTGVCFIKTGKQLADKAIEMFVTQKNVFQSIPEKEELQAALTDAGFGEVTLSRFEVDSLMRFSGTKR
ncbi:MAG: methyltransferase domain-containing protein [Firmicutes bacterium]|nr:methyltransferase domain-containing protein [Bacillota bacterium]